MPARYPHLIAFLLLCVLPLPAAADADLDSVLARVAPPPGVVFEIVTGDGDALERGLPMVRDAATRLRARFPGLPVALVTHGSEQFALLKSETRRAASTHGAVKSLLADSVTVHVCGTHASWRDKAPEDFPEYVDVAASAGSQLNDYRSLGYEVVRIRP